MSKQGLIDRIQVALVANGIQTVSHNSILELADALYELGVALHEDRVAEQDAKTRKSLEQPEDRV